MNNRTAAALLLIVALGAPLAARAASGAEDALPGSSLTVTGHGQISRAPDLATVATTIETHDDNAARALSENNRRFAALTAKLATVGIGASDVVSNSIQSYFNPRPPKEAQIAPGGAYGFIVSRNVGIRVTTLGATGSIVDAATAAGATQISGVSYGFRDRGAVERAALAAAVTDAAAQAAAIAAAAHVQIVRILRIGDQAGSPGRIVPLAMAMSRSTQETVPTTIAPSDLDVAASISITYVIR